MHITGLHRNTFEISWEIHLHIINHVQTLSLIITLAWYKLHKDVFIIYRCHIYRYTYHFLIINVFVNKSLNDIILEDRITLRQIKKQTIYFILLQYCFEKTFSISPVSLSIMCYKMDEILRGYVLKW